MGPGQSDADKPPVRLIVPCTHRGAVLRDEPCPSCPGNIRVKLFACSLHSECTVAKPLGSLACCATCPDFELAMSPNI